MPTSTGLYMLHEVHSNQHKSLESIIVLLQYISVVSPLVAIAYKYSQRGSHMKSSNRS